MSLATVRHIIEIKGTEANLDEKKMVCFTKISHFL